MLVYYSKGNDFSSATSCNINCSNPSEGARIAEECAQRHFYANSPEGAVHFPLEISIWLANGEPRGRFVVEVEARPVFTASAVKQEEPDGE